MLSRICKRTIFVPPCWSHTRNVNVLQEKGIIRYEIPMYMESEMKTELVSVYKSHLQNTIVVEFYIENIEQDAPPTQPKMPELS